MSVYKGFFLAAFMMLCAIGTLTAQQNDVYVLKDSSKGYITVIKDPRFDLLAAKQAEINKKSQRFVPKRTKGWRIQAANTQNRDEANNVKADLLKRFPDEKTYLMYQSPNFRVRIGNFLTQQDAFKLRKVIAAMYPGKGIYIVPDIIEIAPTGDEDEPGDN